MYHTQESRDNRLTSPIICSKPSAWLGTGYYFWYDKDDAHQWGDNFKQATGFYEIYHADLDCSNVLDTVFNEEHYQFWLRQIKKVAMSYIKKTGVKPTLKEINQYFKDKASWGEVSGILFQDIPENQNLSLVISFYYRKRIQLVAYNLSIINNFALLERTECTQIN